jgi:hypothetical protein
MFMIHTPQTIQLYGLKPPVEDGKPEEPAVAEGSITFQHETDDVSKCQMVVRIEDRVYTFNFGTRGPITETSYEDDNTRKAAEERQKEIVANEHKRREEEQAAARASHEHELSTADDTTAKDVSWDAPRTSEPVRGTDGQYLQDKTPDPVLQPHGVVNTTQSMARPHDEFADLRTLEHEPQHGA